MLGEKDIGGAWWFTQLRATQGIHRQSACALGGSEEQGWVCVGIEGREHGHDVQSKTCKERTLALPPYTATFPAWMALFMISSGPFQVHFQWPSRTSLQETNLCFSNIRWASCQKPTFLFLTAPFVAYLSEFSFWLNKWSFPSRIKERSEWTLPPPPTPSENAFPDVVLWSCLKIGFGWSFKNPYNEQGL